MDIRKYQLFADVAETHNFTRSGARLGYSQSGVSHILKSLEQEIGFPLFIRFRHGVRLTQDAQQLLPFVDTMLKDHAALQQRICEINRRLPEDETPAIAVHPADSGSAPQASQSEVRP